VSELGDGGRFFSTFSDGGSRGNPGPAAAAYIVLDSEKHVVLMHGEHLGEMTNNTAEYEGIIRALRAVRAVAVEGGGTADVHVTCFSDSELAVNQLNGKYAVKSPLMRELPPGYLSST